MTKHIELNYEIPKLKYPKMQTLYKRDEKGKIMPYEEYSKKEFELFRYWKVFEKIDGTNVRIFYVGQSKEHPLGSIEIRGRNDNSNMPEPLYNYLESYFTDELLFAVFERADVILFGEGFGPGIQKGGGLYRDDPGFILFDVKIGNWWLDRDKVIEIARQLDVPFVPQIGYNLTLKEIVDMVRSKPRSTVAKDVKIIEGVVCQTNPLVLFRDGKPLKFKLKVRDFE